jgi:hypothetical protein
MEIDKKDNFPVPPSGVRGLKLLIITYYWPPAGGPGVQRWLKFVKYLPEFEIQPIVYVPQNPTYPIIDKNLEVEVSKEAIILKKKIFEPYQIAQFFSKNKTKKISSGIITHKKKQSLTRKNNALGKRKSFYSRCTKILGKSVS